jgi:hypothetical protein
MQRTRLVIALVTLSLTFASYPALALIGVNQCGVGTKPPAGMHCGHDELLLGYRDAAGACVWVCCPPNSDGKTYNCSGDPTPSDFKLDLREVYPRGWRAIFTPAPSFERSNAAK